MTPIPRVEEREHASLTGETGAELINDFNSLEKELAQSKTADKADAPYKE